MNLGRLRALQNDLVGARRIFSLAQGISTDPRLNADLLQNSGQLDGKAGNYRSSLVSLEKAAEAYRAMSDVRGIAGSLHFAALALAALNENAQAITCLEEAVRLRLAVGADDDAVLSLQALAGIYLRQKRADISLTLLTQALELTEKVRIRLMVPDVRALWFTSAQSLADDLTQVLSSLGESGILPDAASRALEVVERTRARGFLDGSRDLANPGPRRAIAHSLGMKSRRLADMPLDPANSASRSALAREIAELELRFHDLEARYSLDPAVPASANQIRNMLQPGELLLVYSLGPAEGKLWAVMRDGIQWWKLPPAAQLEKLASTVLSLMARPNERRTNPVAARSYKVASARLAGILLGPAAPMLPGRRLLVMKDGVLHRIAFAALPLPNSPATLLGTANELVVIPSVSTVLALRERPALPQPAFLVTVFADPVFKDDPRLSSARPRPSAPVGHTRTSGLARLPFSRREAEWIAASAPPGRISLRTGFDASRGVLMQNTSLNSAILHFATHAQADSSNVYSSGIFLSEWTKSGSPTEGFVSLPELYGLSLPAEIAVLSGCDTGLGRFVAGEGLQSLARALFFAGARRIVYSLWKVEDEATAVFMRNFYSALAHLNSPAAALKQARAEMASSQLWADPAYWAAFELVGDSSPLPIPFS